MKFNFNIARNKREFRLKYGSMPSRDNFIYSKERVSMTARFEVESKRYGSSVSALFFIEN